MIRYEFGIAKPFSVSTAAHHRSTAIFSGLTAISRLDGEYILDVRYTFTGSTAALFWLSVTFLEVLDLLSIPDPDYEFVSSPDSSQNSLLDHIA